MNTPNISQAFAAFKSQEVPLSPLAQKVESAGSATPVTARLNYTSVGVCPYCQEPTRKVQCCGQEVFLCEKDRFVSPLPNSEQE